MNERDRLTTDIIEAEWKMFQDVSNAGGRAACQDDFKTFQIMRSSQSANWPEEMLQSYLNDLLQAESAGRNLVTEKYARMMRSTAPTEYARIEHMLAPIDPVVMEMADQIVSIILKWEKELQQKYPNVLGKGRPLLSEEDSAAVTSFETYLRGELATYSIRTVELYLAHLRCQQADNINGSAVIMLDMMKQYGFTSLEEANHRLQAS